MKFNSSRRRSAFMAGVLTLTGVAATGVAAPAVSATSDGSIDPDFGTLGLDLIPATFDAFEGSRTMSVSDGPDARIITSSGRQLVAGRAVSSDPAASDAAVIAISADGGLDTTFAADGIFVDDLGFASSEVFGVYEVEVNSASRYLLVGSRDSNNGSTGGYPFVALLDTNGALVNSFGTGGVLTHTTWDYSRAYRLEAVYIDDEHVFMMLYGDQDLDGDTYSAYDIVSFDISTGAEYFLNSQNRPMSVRTVDGFPGIVPAGFWLDVNHQNVYIVKSSGSSGQQSIAVMKFQVPATGVMTIDSSYGTSGTLTIDGVLTYGSGSELYSFTDGSGVMVVSGTGYPARSLQATRFDRNGAQVTTGFGASGILTVDAITSGYDATMRRTADGGYLVSFQDDSVHLFDSAGAPVTTFGADGVVDNSSYTFKCRRQFQAIGGDSDGDLYLGGIGNSGVYGVTMNPGDAEQTQVMATIKLTSGSGVGYADCYNPETIYPAVVFDDDATVYRITPPEELPGYQMNYADAWVTPPTCTDDYDPEGDYESGDKITITCTGGEVGPTYVLATSSPWTKVVDLNVSSSTPGSGGGDGGGSGGGSGYTPPASLDPAPLFSVGEADGSLLVCVDLNGSAANFVSVSVMPTDFEFGPISEGDLLPNTNSGLSDSSLEGEPPSIAVPWDRTNAVFEFESMTFAPFSRSGPADPSTYQSEPFEVGASYNVYWFASQRSSWNADAEAEASGSPVAYVFTGEDVDCGVAPSDSSTDSSSAGGSTSQAPSLVTSSNQEAVSAPVGSAKLLVNGELVEVELVQAPEELRRSVAGARTFAQVRALQTLAADMVAAVQAVLGDGVTLPITIQNTDTGATITGLVTDPVSGEPMAVPVEDVLLIVNQSIALMVGGADGAGDPANIAFDGVLEFGEGGYVAALAYGLTPGAAGEVVVMSTPRLLDSFTVGADGGVAAQAEIPSDLEAGEHTVVVAIDGQSASLGFRVLPEGGVACDWW